MGRAAEAFNTLFGISSLATVGIEEMGANIKTPKIFQLYYHKDKALTWDMIDRCKQAGFDALALTVGHHRLAATASAICGPDLPHRRNSRPRAC